MGGGGFLGLGPAPSAPAAPNYTAAAQATAAGNLAAAQQATAANRVNQITPYGSLTYKEQGTDSMGNPMWTATTALNAEQQSMLDQQNKASMGLGQTINDQLGMVQNTMNKPFESGARDIQYGGQAPQLNQITAQTPNFQNLSPAQQMQTASEAQQLSMVGQGPQMQNVSNAGQLQTSLNGSSGMAGWDKAQNILNQRLQPQLQLQQEQLDTKLRNQGVMPGTEAYNRAKSSLGMQQNDLINQSQLTAQGIGQNLFNQDLQAGQFGNSALTQQNQNNIASTGFNNSAQQQGFANQLAGTQANNSAITQQNQNQNANIALNNQANQSNFANQQAQLSQNNANAQQAYTNQMGQTQANNAINQQSFANQNASAAANNQAQQQQYNQAMTNYNMPLNTLSSLRTGAQVQNPSFVNSSQQATTQGADLLGAAQMQNNASQAAFNGQQAAQQSANSGLMGLAGTAMMAF